MKIWKIGILLNLISTIVLIGLQLYYENLVIEVQETIVEFEIPPPIIKPVEVVFEDLSVEENLPIIKRKNKKSITEEKKKTPKRKPQMKQSNVERASWYGAQFHGRKTANGETFDMYAVSAAHKTLPIGTWIRVINLKNNKYIDLQINDRGPFIRGRDLDLSYGAAKELGMVETGVVPVKISLL